MAVGYSGKSLAEKIGIKENFKIFILNNPGKEFNDEIRDSLEKTVTVKDLTKDLNLIIFFTKSINEFKNKLPELLRSLKPDGAIWVSWPKKSSKIETDVNDDKIREAALPLGLVDIKICSFTSIWSGLKLVIRKEFRK
jgi:Protein of unknown function (DUF3052)